MNPTLVTRQDLGRIAKNFLNFLDKQKITSLLDLKSKINHNSLPDENKREAILIQSRPSNIGTDAYTISYIVPGRGILLEVRVNEILQYSQIITKGDFTLQGYEPFVQDEFGNTIQNKQLNFTDIPKIKLELEELVNYQ